MEMANKIIQLVVSMALATSFMASTNAYEAGDIIIRGGIGLVEPVESSTDLVIQTPELGTADGVRVGLNNDVSVGGMLGYFISDRVSLELLIGLPFEHDIIAAGDYAQLGTLGSTKHVPPILTFNYFLLDKRSSIQPYIGAGFNYTYFFDEETTDTLTASVGTIANIAAGAPLGVTATSTELSIDSMLAPALAIGSDFKLSKRFGLNAAVYWAKADTTANITAQTNAGTVKASIDLEVDPFIYVLTSYYVF